MKSLVLALCLIATSASAQTTGEQKAADIASWVVMGAAVAVDASQCPHAEQQTRCWVTLGIRQGTMQGASIVIARLFPRQRPCAPSCGIDSNDSDVPSRHVGTTAATFPGLHAGPRLVVAASATTVVALLRGKANKHDLLGVASGAAVGWACSFIR